MSFSSKPMLETWYDVLKRVMRLSKSSPLSKKAKEENKDKQQNRDDANDFYVYMYDEED
jgi:hypothetical protein